MDFKGKVALITGGAQGIGRAYASALLEVGMKVCICDLLEDPAEEFIENLSPEHKDNVIFQKCDVTSYDDFRGAFDKVISTFGRIDMVINNAGCFNEKNWIKEVEVNFIGVVYGTKLAFEYMDPNKGGHGGHVINTASEAGLGPNPLAPVYTGTKHAVVGFTRSYGSDYHFEKTGIKVGAICPGPVDTGFFKAYPSCTLDEELCAKQAAELKPVKPEDVATALMRLLQDGKNGAILRIDIEGLRYA